VISVVVSSIRSPDMLEACLASLRPQCDAVGAELIVARATPASGRASASSGTNPPGGVRFVPVAEDASEPVVRSAGVAAAGGEWVILTEDHCIADPMWLHRMMAALPTESGPALPSGEVHVVGGSIRPNASDGVLARAAFVAEYGFYGGNAVGKGAPPIAAANVAYHRSVLPQAITRFSAGEWENALHDHLFASGHRLIVVADAIVRPMFRPAFVRHLRDRYVHGRAYASARRVSRQRLVLVLLGAPVLPFLLATRCYRALATGDRAACATAMPLAIILLAGWTAGELAGYASRARVGR
jgi:hypothetical protein